MTTSVSCHRITPDAVCATFTHDDVSFTALRYTRYPDSPTAPPLTSSSALTADHRRRVRRFRRGRVGADGGVDRAQPVGLIQDRVPVRLLREALAHRHR